MPGSPQLIWNLLVMGGDRQSQASDFTWMFTELPSPTHSRSWYPKPAGTGPDDVRDKHTRLQGLIFSPAFIELILSPEPLSIPGRQPHCQVPGVELTSHSALSECHTWPDLAVQEVTDQPEKGTSTGLWWLLLCCGNLEVPTLPYRTGVCSLGGRTLRVS